VRTMTSYLAAHADAAPNAVCGVRCYRAACAAPRSPVRSSSHARFPRHGELAPPAPRRTRTAARVVACVSLQLLRLLLRAQHVSSPPKQPLSLLWPAAFQRRRWLGSCRRLCRSSAWLRRCPQCGSLTSIWCVFALLHSSPASLTWPCCRTLQLAASLALFGLVYRYAARDDGSPRLKQGLVGAFVAVRTLAHVTPTATCAAVPLVCGPPLLYADWAMLAQGAAAAAPAGVAFAAAALALEFAGDLGIVKRATNGGADL